MSVDVLTDFSNVSHVTKQSKTSFYYSFSFLPKHERNALYAVYAFCREIDDIVDSLSYPLYESVPKKRERLMVWRNDLANIYNNSNTKKSLLPLATVIKQFDLPKQYFLTLIDGCERDLLQNRYETFAELKEYCFSVASIVGLLCIEIFGYRHEDTKEYAINLGYALQLTNIIRDIKTDKDRGYIYLPQEDLERFSYSEEDLFAERYSPNFVELMEFQSRRAREFYSKARAALRPDERSTMVTAEIMDKIYFRLLEKIELNDFHVFSKRMSVTTAHKFLIALKHWISSKVLSRKM